MNTGEFEGDELLLGRLREGASGDAAVRQLRRRYDSLRTDYERLLDRLGELEEKLEEPTPTSRPQPASGESPAGTVSHAIALPLIRLRDEYLSAATRMQAIVSGLERLAAGALKGQHPAVAAEAPAQPPPAPEAADTPADREAAQAPPAAPQPSSTRPQKVHLDVRGRGFGELLDFQERLSAVPGVSRVSINAIDADRATLIVELEANVESSGDSD